MIIQQACQVALGQGWPPAAAAAHAQAPEACNRESFIAAEALRVDRRDKLATLATQPHTC
jgi:hypothetical protein